MNKKFMIGGCAAVAVAGNVFAAAEEDYSYFNPYASLKGGYAFLGKRNDIKYKGGFAGAVELGVSYDAWRLGLELAYKSNKIKEVAGNKYSYMLGGKIKLNAAAANLADLTDNSIFRSGVANQPFNGAALNHWYLKDITRAEMTKLTALTGMVNVFYDYAMTEAWSVYAGIGLGVARVAYTVQSRHFKDVHDMDCNGTALPPGGAAEAKLADLPDAVKTAYNNALGTIFNDIKDVKTEHSKTVFAWQFMAGVGYEFNENWKLTLGYKLFNTAKVKLGDTKIKTPFNHTLEAGLTYSF